MSQFLVVLINIVFRMISLRTAKSTRAENYRSAIHGRNHLSPILILIGTHKQQRALNSENTSESDSTLAPLSCARRWGMELSRRNILMRSRERALNGRSKMTGLGNQLPKPWQKRGNSSDTLGRKTRA